MSLCFDEEAKLVKLKEESFKRMSEFKHKLRMDEITYEMGKRKSLEDYKSKLIAITKASGRR